MNTLRNIRLELTPDQAELLRNACHSLGQGAATFKSAKRDSGQEWGEYADNEFLYFANVLASKLIDRGLL